jgi:lysophospholipase L1-like esterase
VYAIGDSLTFEGEYLAKLQALLGNAYCVVNKGVSGNKTSDMLARFSADIKPDGRYVVIWGGVNSVDADVSAASIESDLQDMYDLAHGMGQKVVAVNITPTKTSIYWTSARQVVMDAVNSWIAGSNADYKIDMYSLLESSPGSDTLAAAYDSGDHLHLSTAGYNLVGTTVRNGVIW